MYKTVPPKFTHNLQSSVHQNQQSNNSLTECPLHHKDKFSTLYVCLEEVCLQKYKGAQNRILCSECIDQQRHSGHLIFSFNKFSQLLKQYNNFSLKTCQKVIQKVSTLRADINLQIDALQNKIISLLSFNIQSEHNTTSKNRNPSITLDTIKLATNPSNISQWNDILKATQRGLNRSDVMEDIFIFKEEIVSEQIQNIFQLLRQNFVESMTNIEFTVLNKNLLFNPDDMHSFGVGLTLNRNSLEAVEAIGNQIVSSVQANDKTISSVAMTGCKLAFTQVPNKSDISRSFQLTKINTKILIGCVDQEAYEIIGQDSLYQNCEKFIYGISVSSQGEVISYCKSNPPRLINNCKIKEGDIVQMAIHAKQNQISFIQYRFLLQEFSQEEEEEIGDYMPSVYASPNGNLRKKLVTTIDLQPPNINPYQNKTIFYPFAGVAKQGDEVRLVQNIVLIRRQSGQCTENLKQSSELDEDNRQLLSYFDKLSKNKETG